MAQNHLDQFVGDIDPAFRAGKADATREEAASRNVALLREVFGAVARGDFDAAARAMHDEVELEIAGPAALPFLGRWRGRAEVAEAMRRNFGMLEDQAPEIRSIEAKEDRVDVVFHERGRFRDTGAAYAVLCAQHFTIGDGKIRRVDQFVEDLDPTVEA
ncbi:nuclear transport factor 2 family protein [Paludisphaera soli]|uniref:nuclear transport factor 2 family protein n=1 Tax=Paludisphaera soli TaxID=2712865 RepID=UPI0013E9C12B|nr:nuclear transport factor 2 family protein [Paludisphaera soli]